MYTVAVNKSSDYTFHAVVLKYNMIFFATSNLIMKDNDISVIITPLTCIIHYFTSIENATVVIVIPIIIQKNPIVVEYQQPYLFVIFLDYTTKGNDKNNCLAEIGSTGYSHTWFLHIGNDYLIFKNNIICLNICIKKRDLYDIKYNM